MEASVSIEPYNAVWPQHFAAERDSLARALAPWLAGPIEHVGSTAVPGLAAKPVIDIMAAVRSLEDSRAALPALERLGYRYAPYRAEVMHWLCKPRPDFRTHQLHLVPFGSPLWKDRIAFRDRLRSEEALAREYERLKRQLAQRYANDREAYTDAKGPFIERVLRAPAPEDPAAERLPSIEGLIPVLRARGIELPAAVRVGAFGDSAGQSRALLALIRSGRKRAGTSLLWAHEAQGEAIPGAGDIEVVVDHANAPCLVTRITEVEVVPFNAVGAGFAAREGEGDGSLEYWRREHWDFFSRECRRLGREPSETMPVVCASFELVDVLA